MPKTPRKQSFHCAVTTCLYYGELSGVCQFPDSPKRCEDWAKSLGLEKWKKRHYVCHAHFSKDDFYMFDSGKKKLKPHAVPKIKPSVSFYFILFLND